MKKIVQVKSGIKPNDTLILYIEEGKLILKKKNTFLDLARSSPVYNILTSKINLQLDQEINEELES